MVADRKVKSIVFLVYWPVTAREEKRWHFDFLRQQGFNVEVYDLTDLLNKNEILKHPVPEESSGPHIRKIRSYGELTGLIKEFSRESVFVDYMIGLSDIDLKTEKAFRILKRYDARYYVIAAGVLPLPSRQGGAAGLTDSLLKKLKKASDPHKLADYVSRKLISQLRKHGVAYPLPHGIFGGESEALKNFAARYNLGGRVIPVHSLDYDTYLEHVRSKDFTGKTEKTCVFLDEAATHHPDFKLLKIEPISSDRYFSVMRRLFDHIEGKTGLQVVVAAHPRSKYEDMPGAFGDRKVIRDKTIELVSKSSMVVAHASTSVSFAVLFDKPLLFVKTSEMEENGYSILVDTMARSVGLEATNIDDKGSLDRISSGSAFLKGKRYEEYKYKYIKSRGVKDVTVWEVVAETIKSGSNWN